MSLNDHWIARAIEAAKSEGCKKGFFGEVAIRLKIQDGTIQTAMVEKSIRLRSDEKKSMKIDSKESD